MDENTIKEYIKIWESRLVEFKSSEKFEKDFRAHISKTIISMANTKSGGKIFIGFDEKTKNVQGLSQSQKATWEKTKIGNYLKNRVNPLPNFSIINEVYEEKDIIILDIKEFQEIPHIIIKEIASTKHTFALEGDILIRNENAESTKLKTESDTRDIIRRCISKKKEVLLEDFSSILEGKFSKPKPIDYNKTFFNNLPQWDIKKNKFLLSVKEKVYFEFKIIPLQNIDNNSNLNFNKILENIVVDLNNTVELPNGFPAYYQLRDSLEIYNNYCELLKKKGHLQQFWQLSPTGSIGIVNVFWSELSQQGDYFNHPPPPKRLIPLEYVCRYIHLFLKLVNNILDYYSSDNIWIRIS